MKTILFMLVFWALLPMAVLADESDPVWSYGESVLFNSSGTTAEPDNAWGYGKSKLQHEYVESGGGAPSTTLPIQQILIMSNDYKDSEGGLQNEKVVYNTYGGAVWATK